MLELVTTAAGLLNLTIAHIQRARQLREAVGDEAIRIVVVDANELNARTVGRIDDHLKTLEGK